MEPCFCTTKLEVSFWFLLKNSQILSNYTEKFSFKLLERVVARPNIWFQV